MDPHSCIYSWIAVQLLIFIGGWRLGLLSVILVTSSHADHFPQVFWCHFFSVNLKQFLYYITDSYMCLDLFLHFISVQLLCLVIQYLTFNYYYIIIWVHLNIFRYSLPFFFFFFRIVLFLCIIIPIWALESSCLLKSKFDIFNGIILNLQVYHLHRIWYNSPVDQVLFLGLYSL